MKSWLAWAGLVALATGLAGSSAGASPATGKNDFSIVSLGDLLYTAPQAGTDDPDLKKVISLIGAGDVAIANQEGEAFDLATFTG